MTIIAFQYQPSRHEYIVSHLKQSKKVSATKDNQKIAENPLLSMQLQQLKLLAINLFLED